MDKETWGFVYFIEAVGLDLIKIGWTERQPGERLATLDTACPVPLRPLGLRLFVMGAESLIHDLWCDLRRKGEWFEATPALRDFIGGIARPWPAPGEVIPIPHHYYVGLGIVQPPPIEQFMVKV